MYYVLCEESLNNSIKYILVEFGDGLTYKQIDLGKGKNIEFDFKSIILSANVGDTIILIVDNMLDCSIVDNFIQITKEKVIKFGYTNYSCFEELFLSYEGQLYWVFNSLICR